MFRFHFGPRADEGLHFCHECRSVTHATQEGDDLQCERCEGTFVEAIDATDTPSQFYGDDMGSAGDDDQTMQDSMASDDGDEDDEDTDPMLFFGELLQRMARERGAGNMRMIQGGRGGGNPGDYVQGNRQFDNLLAQLFGAAQSSAPPPASAEAIASLPKRKVTAKDLKKDEKRACAVCQDDFEVGTETVELPCGHLYHEDCVKPWLRQHNTCPTCRHELPAANDDERQNEDTAPARSNQSAPRFSMGSRLFRRSSNRDNGRRSGGNRRNRGGRGNPFMW